MNVKTMRRLDKWLGVPACVVLTCWRRLVDLLRPRRTATRRIGLLKLAEQGATVLAFPAIQRAVRMVGADNLFFVVFAENRPILDLMGVVPERNVIAIRTKGGATFAADLLRALWRMRRERIDTVVDFEFFARSSAIISYLSGAAKRVGFHAYAGGGPYRGDLFTHRLSFNSHLHAAEVFLLQIEAIDAPPERLPAMNLALREPSDELARFTPAAAETESVRRTLAEVFGNAGNNTGNNPGRNAGNNADNDTDNSTIAADAPLILLNANCSDLLPLRRWADDRYVELAHRLLAKYPEVRIAFTGAPSEARPVEQLVRRIGSDRVGSMAGRTTMRELLALYDLAELLITNDSGPAHFASLTSVDVITIFGPETPAAFGVRSPRSHVLWAGLACSPCVNAYNNRESACRDNLCMQAITVDAVFATACEVYEARLAGSVDAPLSQVPPG